MATNWVPKVQFSCEKGGWGRKTKITTNQRQHISRIQEYPGSEGRYVKKSLTDSTETATATATAPPVAPPPVAAAAATTATATETVATPAAAATAEATTVAVTLFPYIPGRPPAA